MLDIRCTVPTLKASPLLIDHTCSLIVLSTVLKKVIAIYKRSVRSWRAVSCGEHRPFLYGTIKSLLYWQIF